MIGQTTITLIKIRLSKQCYGRKKYTIANKIGSVHCFKFQEEKMSSEIRDLNLAESGELKIEWVKRNCDLLRMLEEEFAKTKPFAGKKIALSVHLEAKTAYLCRSGL